jgi:hypothetical protein
MSIVIQPKTTIPENSACPAVLGILFNGEYINGYQVSANDIRVLAEELAKDSKWRFLIDHIKSIPTPTNQWVNLYGAMVEVEYSDGKTEILRPGTLLTARTKAGVSCGSFFVREKGKFGFLHVYADDSYTPYIEDGVKPGDKFRMFLNDKPCKEEFTWSGNGDRIEVKKLTVL